MKKLFLTAVVAVMSSFAFGQSTNLKIVNNTGSNLVLEEITYSTATGCTELGTDYPNEGIPDGDELDVTAAGPPSVNWGRLIFLQPGSGCMAKTVDPTYSCLGTDTGDYSPCTTFTFTWSVSGGVTTVTIT
jgi:hypothetical protein